MAATLNDLVTQLSALRAIVDQLKADVAKLTPPAPIDLSEQVKNVTDAISDLTTVDSAVKTVTG